MKFKIIEIIQERCIDGMKTITAEAQDENSTIIKVSYKTSELVDFNANSLSILFNNAYSRQRVTKGPKIGDII